MKKRKEMKKLLAIVFAVLMVIGTMTACSNDGGQPPAENTGESNSGKSSSKEAGTPSDSGEAKLVGVSLSDYSNIGLRLLADSIKENLETEGYKVVILDGKEDQSVQINDIEDIINQGASMIICAAVDSVGIKPAVEACQAADIPYINVSQFLDESLLDMVAADITANNYNAGYQLGEIAAEAIEHKGNVVMYTFNSSFVCAERSDGFREAISQYPDIKILEEFDGLDVAVESGLNFAEDCMQKYPELDSIFCINTNIGVGVAAAMQSANKSDDIFVVSIDGYEGELQAMLNGSLDATAIYPMREMAEIASKYAKEILTTGTCDGKPELNFTIVTQDNYDEYKNYWE